MKETKLLIDQVQHYFQTPQHQRIDVLQDITIEVREGEFVSIIGPSGSGKSTLLQIIGGLISPVSGEVYLDGINIKGKKGFISYMPQQASLFPWKTIEENIILVQEIIGNNKNISLLAVREWIVRAGLGGYERNYPHQLSGGMQQRVSFLRALLSPQLFMCLDEPFSSLDAMTRMDMQQWLLQIWEATNRSVLFVTHHIEEALYLSDRIYLISDKPAKIVEQIEVPFKRPRKYEIQSDTSFIKLKNKIYEKLKNSH